MSWHPFRNYRQESAKWRAENEQRINEPRQPEPRQEPNWGKRIFILLLVIAVVFVGVHVISAKSSKNSPPAQCQLFGGHWNIWSGWTCNG